VLSILSRLLTSKPPAETICCQHSADFQNPSTSITWWRRQIRIVEKDMTNQSMSLSRLKMHKHPVHDGLIAGQEKELHETSGE